jgi:hypothetical protein
VPGGPAFLNCPPAQQERDQPKHQENDEENLRDPDSGSGESAESQYGRDQSENQKHQ